MAVCATAPVSHQGVVECQEETLAFAERGHVATVMVAEMQRIADGAEMARLDGMQQRLALLLPNILLSGFMFPVAAMPPAARWLAEILPLTHFLRVDRGLLLKGADLAHLAGDVATLTALLAGLVVVAALRVRTRLG